MPAESESTDNVSREGGREEALVPWRADAAGSRRASKSSSPAPTAPIPGRRARAALPGRRIWKLLTGVEDRRGGRRRRGGIGDEIGSEASSANEQERRGGRWV
nr:unnamed protein product [Digitaria exilis]